LITCILSLQLTSHVEEVGLLAKRKLNIGIVSFVEHLPLQIDDTIFLVQVLDNFLYVAGRGKFLVYHFVKDKGQK
jgi:hypothetical protein